MDNRRKRVIVASVIAVAVAVALAAALYQNNRPPGNPPPVGPGSNVSGGNVTGPPAQIKQPISVLAPPSSLPFVEKWVAQYNNGKHAATVRVDYTGEVDHISIGPVYSNVSDFLGRHLADMAIAGRPAQRGGNLTSSGSQFLPVSPQAIAVVYNVPGFPDVPSGLRLDPPTLVRILGGNITRWDDPAIKGLNPGTNLPNDRIVVVHERRDDSATVLLSEYLSNGTAWPKDSQAADSADSLSTIVRQTPYSIGYVDFSYAVQTRMTYAALKNSAGEFVAPSTDSVGAAIRNGTVATGPEPPETAVGRLGGGSYPIVGFYYAAFGPVNATSGKAAAVLDFVRWIAGREGQQVLADMQYPSVYEQDRALKTMAGSLSNGTAGQNATRFENATDLTMTSGDSVYGQVAADGDSVYVAWQESTDDPPDNYEIFFKRSLDGGATFGNAVNVSSNDGISEHPQLAASGKNAYVVWTDDSSETGQVMFAKSSNGGATFGKADGLSDPDRESFDAEISASGGAVYVVWQEQDTDGNNAVLLRASSNSGGTFGDPVEIASGSLVGPESYPKVAAYGGRTFSGATNLSRDPAPSECPSISASAGRIFVTWEDPSTGDHEIFMAKSKTAPLP